MVSRRPTLPSSPLFSLPLLSIPFSALPLLSPLFRYSDDPLPSTPPYSYCCCCFNSRTHLNRIVLPPLSSSLPLSSEFSFSPYVWSREQMASDLATLGVQLGAIRSESHVPGLDPPLRTAILASKQVSGGARGNEGR